MTSTAMVRARGPLGLDEGWAIFAPAPEARGPRAAGDGHDRAQIAERERAAAARSTFARRAAARRASVALAAIALGGTLAAGASVGTPDAAAALVSTRELERGAKGSAVHKLQ